jgi:hypothetical protein
MGKVRITFSVDEELLAEARAIAKANGTTFSKEARDWLENYGREWRERKEREAPEDGSSSTSQPARSPR